MFHEGMFKILRPFLSYVLSGLLFKKKNTEYGDFPFLNDKCAKMDA